MREKKQQKKQMRSNKDANVPNHNHFSFVFEL